MPKKAQYKVSKEKGREAPSDCLSADATPRRIPYSRPTLIQLCLDFIVVMGLSNKFQYYLDSKGFDFKLTEYYDKGS